MIKFLQTPGKVKKYVLGGILVFICLAMTTYLIPGFTSGSFGGGAVGVLAKVGGTEITVQDAQQMADRMARSQFPSGVPPALMPFLTQRALQTLVTQKALLLEADRMGLTVSDADLSEYLHKSPQIAPVLFPNGQFIGAQRYEELLRQNNMTVPQFERDTKEQILLTRLQNLVEGSVSVSQQEMMQDYMRKNTQVKFQYAVVNAEDIMKQIKPTDAELKAFFEKNKDRYKNAIPEKRKAAYVVIDPATLMSRVQVTPQDLRTYYSQHIDQYRVPEEVTLRQIVIKTPAAGPDGKEDQKAVDAARAKAQDIFNKVKSGGNFAEVAKKYSEDATAKDGGSIGTVRRGQLPPEIDKVAFSLDQGQTSGVIQVPGMGFFIVQVENKQVARLKPLDEVKPQIEPIIARDKATVMADNLSRKVEADAKANGLQAAASKNGLDVAQTGFVTSNDSLPGLGAAPEFMRALFQAKQNDPPQLAQTADGYAVFQVQAIQPPAAPTFEDVRQRVETDFKNERAQVLFAQKLEQLSDRAHAQHSLAAAAKEVGATLKTSELVKPDGQVPDVGSLANSPASVVFTMKPGDISGPLTAGRNGLVITLLDKQEPSPADFASQKEQIREQLLSQKQDEMMELFASNLQERLQKEKKIVLYPNELKKLAKSFGDQGE
jgi:peptidyl-prolyl cis-trans isomerase D